MDRIFVSKVLFHALSQLSGRDIVERIVLQNYKYLTAVVFLGFHQWGRVLW